MAAGVAIGMLIAMGMLLIIVGATEWAKGTGPWGLNGLIYWLAAGVFFGVAVMASLLTLAVSMVLTCPTMTGTHAGISTFLRKRWPNSPTPSPASTTRLPRPTLRYSPAKRVCNPSSGWKPPSMMCG